MELRIQSKRAEVYARLAKTSISAMETTTPAKMPVESATIVYVTGYLAKLVLQLCNWRAGLHEMCNDTHDFNMLLHTSNVAGSALFGQIGLMELHKAFPKKV